MTRIVSFGARYRRAADRVGAVPGSTIGRDVGRTIAALAAADVLPGIADMEALIPPTSTAHVRRVPGRNLWIWYTATGNAVRVITITDSPPVPIN